MGEREERFSLLVNRNGDAVLRYISNRYVGNGVTDAEDLLAEVMTVAWRRLDEIPRDAEVPWLYAVARNCVLHARSKGARRQRIFSQLRPSPNLPAAEDVALADLSVRRALARLPTLEREALTLTVWEGLTPSELAIALNVSKNTAAVRLSRAKARFRELLDESDSVISATDAERTR